MTYVMNAIRLPIDVWRTLSDLSDALDSCPRSRVLTMVLRILAHLRDEGYTFRPPVLIGREVCAGGETFTIRRVPTEASHMALSDECWGRLATFDEGWGTSGNDTISAAIRVFREEVLEKALEDPGCFGERVEGMVSFFSAYETSLL